jgi:hypothetical protein
MKRLRISRPGPSTIISCVALFAALGGTSYAAGMSMSSGMHSHPMSDTSRGAGMWANHLGGLPASDYLLSRHVVSSRGVRFLRQGQMVDFATAGHFTFYATCSMAASGAQTVTFGVKSNTTADMDGNGPMPAGSSVVIHQDSDQLNSTSSSPLTAGQFTQVASASSSTEIANGGQEVDVFYTDGVNWGGSSGIPYHACFAGYNGILNGPMTPGM